MATKKSTKKSQAVKKTTVKRVGTKKAVKKSALRTHIGLQSEEAAFMTFRITKQTLYWLVFGVVVIMFTVWLMKLQSDIQSLYDQIDSTNIETSAL